MSSSFLLPFRPHSIPIILLLFYFSYFFIFVIHTSTIFHYKKFAFSLNFAIFFTPIVFITIISSTTCYNSSTFVVCCKSHPIGFSASNYSIVLISPSSSLFYTITTISINSTNACYSILSSFIVKLLLQPLLYHLLIVVSLLHIHSLASTLLVI